MLREFLDRRRFNLQADRIGPDLPFTHWMLYFPSSMRKLCRSKFRNFGPGAEFRPGAYSIGCSKISIGNDVIIRPGTMLFADPRPEGAGIVIGHHVLIGSGVHIYCGNHRFSDPTVPIYFQGHLPSRPVVLGTGSWIGANSILLPGVTVGENAVVGAGSVVTKDVPPRTVAVGNPARVIRRLETP